MRRSRALKLSCLLVSGLTAGFADNHALAKAPAAPTAPAVPAPQDSDETPYDNNKTPLPDSDFLLLSRNGYRVQSDGTIRPPGSTRPVGKSEMQYVLDELIGHQRMQAMLQLDVIFNQYGTKNLPDDALQDLRRVGRQNWTILPDRVRKDLRTYFSDRELEAMDSGLRPVRVPQTWLPLEAPGPYQIADSTASETVAAAQNEPSPTSLTPSEQALVDRLLQRASTTAAVSDAVPAAPTPSTAPASPFTFHAAPAEPLKSAQTAALPASAIAANLPSGGAIASPAAPPALPTDSAAATFVRTTALPVLNADYPNLSTQGFEKFLADAPYNRDVKTLLTKISEHAPSETRWLALGLVVKHLPQIAIDAQGAGSDMYAQIARISDDPNQPAKYSIALNPGPLIHAQKKLLLETKEFLLPDAKSYYQALGAMPPAAQSANPENAAARTLVEDWGLTRKFDDGSQRLLYTPEEMAGTLFYELLTLDARMRRLDTDPYRSELRARFYQFVFYRKLREETGNKPLLNRALQTEYDEWLSRPADYWDFAAQAEAAPGQAAIAPDLSGPRDSRNAWKRDRDLLLLKEAGLVSSGSIQKPGIPKAADFAAPPSDVAEKLIATELHALGDDSPAGKDWLAAEGKLRDTLNEKK